jgi:hypothetical protein
MGFFGEFLLAPCLFGFQMLLFLGVLVFGIAQGVSGAIRRGSYFGILVILFLLTLSVGSFAAIFFWPINTPVEALIAGFVTTLVGILLLQAAFAVAVRFVNYDSDHRDNRDIPGGFTH